LLYSLGGLAYFSWTEDLGALFRIAIIALVAPAVGEELLFRVLLLPPPGPLVPAWRIALSTGLFVLWHPPQALLFGPHWAAVVLNPGFLAAVAVLGIALCRLYTRTGSIWPCVLLHWAAVVAWKAFLGGPSPWPA
jgi:predicted Abi (CAAX) family protease